MFLAIRFHNERGIVGQRHPSDKGSDISFSWVFLLDTSKCTACNLMDGWPMQRVFTSAMAPVLYEVFDHPKHDKSASTLVADPTSPISGKESSQLSKFACV